MDQPLQAQPGWPEALKSFRLVPGGTGAAHQRGKGLSEVRLLEKVSAAHGELLWVSPALVSSRRLGGLFWGEESSSSGLITNIRVLWCPLVFPW